MNRVLRYLRLSKLGAALIGDKELLKWYGQALRAVERKAKLKKAA